MKYFLRSVHYVWVLSLVFLIAASMATAEPYREPATGLVFPDSIAGMDKGKVTVFDNPNLGVAIGYNVPGAAMTVFIYNLGLKEIPADVSRPVFKAQFDQAIGDIHRAGKMGILENVRQLPGNEVIVMPGTSGTKALFASFAYQLHGRDMNSKLFLTQYRNNWVKLRYSCEAAMGNKGGEFFQGFITELSAILEKGR